MATSLDELIAQHDVGRIVAVGNSAGGYAALLFGTLLGADAVLSFSPQTVLDREAMAEMDDHRYDSLLVPLAGRGGLEEPWTDLRCALPAARRADTIYSVLFDDTLRLDHLHAERLRGLEGVRLYRFGRGGHRLAHQLRDCGALDRVLRRALQLPGGPVVQAAAAAS